MAVKTILISAGHSTVSPRDPGAVGNGYTEAYLAVELRDLVADELRKRGCKVIEDGADGENQPLKKAISLARQADIAIEFHWNAGPPSATGIEVLSKPNKKDLAQAVAGAISSVTKLKLRGDAGWKSDSSGQHHRLGFCEAGGLVVEVCFISSKVDMAAYTAHKQAVVNNIADIFAVSNSAAELADNVHSDSTENPGESPDLPPDPTDQVPPPIKTEESTQTITAGSDATVVRELKATVDPPKGDAPHVEPRKVTTNGPLAKWLFSGGGLLGLGTAVWGFVQSNLNAVAIGIICVTVLILAIIFRGAITDAIRMQTAADPDKRNVT